MKVAIIVDQPHWTGVGIYAVELYQLLKPKLPELKLIYVGAVEDDLNLYEKIDYLRREYRLLLRPTTIKKNYKKLINDDRYKDYLFHYVGTDFFALKKRPGIITIHDLIHDKVFTSANLSIKNLLNAFERFRKYRSTIILSKKATRIICMSQVVKKQIEEKTGLNSILINRWIVNDYFTKRDKRDTRNKLGLEEDYLYFLSVGNNRQNKRTDLIKIFSDLLPSKCKMIKIGHPINSVNCINMGKVDDEDYPLYFNASDAYVHLSDNEGLGLPLLEALGSDLPVICRNLDINREILGDCAIIIEEKNLREEVIDIVNKISSKDFVSLIQKEIQIRKELFNPNNSMELYIKLYGDVLN
ncbi:glycosyltransferase [Cuniculiplasma divulgatum]|uniref:Glycosyltransferase n=1 Tax=Cuniculiplasma divulgatum TaxID=1673428 RepID=A0A1N5UKV1_9ARCH|nr:glycosyltransferase [Cuniculiplasma divulgatum]SIM61331.1 glycosyltransferase [Cuniculiplasma divulgatum]SJK84853.1 glycosyltransferase [Cuniculiplasma divulgatum]